MRYLLPFLALFTAPAFAATSVQNENTRATLLASHASIKAGDIFSAGVLLEPRTGWHTYWENPGDAGIPTTLEWALPQGITSGEIQWPPPSVIREDTLAVYGYEGDVLLPIDITVPADFSGTTLPVMVKASWLVCDNICVPESADLTLDIPLGTVTPSPDAERFTRAKSALPTKIDAAISYHVNGDKISLTLPESISATSASFFPRESNVIEYAKPQTFADHVLSIARNMNEEIPNTLSGVLITEDKTYDIRLEKNSAPVTSSPTSHSPINFFFILFSAVIGGMILNLMPCVLPILSLKALAIAKKSGHHRKAIVLQSLAYTVGILISFAAIAWLLISLQQAGQVIGWGYQMQSPPFVAFLAILLFLVGLNLVGMFELPVLFGNVLADTREHKLRGSFATGILAVAVAAPCTAPFMATAVGATITLPPVLAMLVFIAIGFGLALPFLLIALFPRMIALLPKPGAWMETFKQLLAFPMFASVTWLLWVLTVQTGATGLLIALITMLTLAFIIWLKGHCQDASLFCRIAVLLLLIAALINGLTAITHVRTYASVQPDASHFSESKLADLRAKNIPVFVDATAAWCLTCQVNKRVAIDTPTTRATFEKTGTTLLIADWTNRDAEISLFLKRFGYNGVPLYVYFPAGGEPKVLPQLLSESLVIEILEGIEP